MNRYHFYSGFFWAAIMCFTFSSCGNDPITSWDSPRMLALKREWTSLHEEVKKDPSIERQGPKLSKLTKLEGGILDKLSLDDLRHLAAKCDMLPINEKNPDVFEFNVLQLMVRQFINAGDRDALVMVLSTRYPVYVCPETTTAYALVFWQGKLKDPVLILGDAYARCKVPEVRREIAMEVRRGFWGFDIPGKDDAEYVKNAMLWYEREKDHIKLRETSTKETYDLFFEMLPTARQGPK